MSTVKEIESAIQGLDPVDLKELVGWIEDYLEDQMEFTDEFKASIEQAKRDIAEGRVRVVKPGA